MSATTDKGSEMPVLEIEVGSPGFKVVFLPRSLHLLAARRASTEGVVTVMARLVGWMDGGFKVCELVNKESSVKVDVVFSAGTTISLNLTAPSSQEAVTLTGAWFDAEDRLKEVQTKRTMLAVKEKHFMNELKRKCLERLKAREETLVMSMVDHVCKRNYVGDADDDASSDEDGS